MNCIWDIMAVPKLVDALDLIVEIHLPPLKKKNSRVEVLPHNVTVF